MLDFWFKHYYFCVILLLACRFFSSLFNRRIVLKIVTILFIWKRCKAFYLICCHEIRYFNFLCILSFPVRFCHTHTRIASFIFIFNRFFSVVAGCKVIHVHFTHRDTPHIHAWLIDLYFISMLIRFQVIYELRTGGVNGSDRYVSDRVKGERAYACMQCSVHICIQVRWRTSHF